MTRASASELRRLRVRAHGLAGDHPADVTEAAKRLLAVQAQDLPAARWALGARVPGSVEHEVTDAFNSGDLVRHWPLRGTLQIVPRDDLRWLLALTAERQWQKAAQVRRQWGVDDSALETAREASVTALAGGRGLTRAELSTVIEHAGVAMSGGRGYHVLYALAITGTLVWAAAAGTSQRLALLDEWVPAAPQLDHDEALGLLVARYLAGHGPATVADLAWWAGVPTGWVKRGAEIAGARVLEVDRTEYLIDNEDARPTSVPPGVILLPSFDEYLLGYQLRDLVLPPQYRDRVVRQRNGRFQPIVVRAGHIVGTWTAERGAVTVEPFDAGSPIDDNAVASASERFRRFGAAPR